MEGRELIKVKAGVQGWSGAGNKSRYTKFYCR